MTDEAIFMLDPQGRVAGCQASAEGVLGCPLGQIVGTHFSTLYSAGTGAAGIAEQALAIAERNGRYQAQAWRVKEDGTRFRTNITIEPLHDGGGRLVGFVTITKVLDGAGAHSAGVSQATELLSTRTHDIAHDLSNALQVVKHGLELLRRRVAQSDESAHGAIDLIRRGSDEATGLLQQLFALTEEISGRPAAVTARAAPAAIPDEVLKGLRVLVAEDEALVGMLVEDLLDQLGCELKTMVTSVGEALSIVQDPDIDLALLDINLQGQSAYGVAEILRNRGVPVVFMSGQKELDDGWRGHPFVQKPFELDQLKKEMERALASR